MDKQNGRFINRLWTRTTDEQTDEQSGQKGSITKPGSLSGEKYQS